MTFIDAIAALVILSFFFFGFSQAFLPTMTAWEAAMAEHRTAKTIYFIAESFRQECNKPGRDIENWIKQVAVARELENCEITELRQGGDVRALKAVCIISGERVEIIGLCTP